MTWKRYCPLPFSPLEVHTLCDADSNCDGDFNFEFGAESNGDNYFDYGAEGDDD